MGCAHPPRRAARAKKNLSRLPSTPLRLRAMPSPNVSPPPNLALAPTPTPDNFRLPHPFSLISLEAQSISPGPAIARPRCTSSNACSNPPPRSGPGLKKGPVCTSAATPPVWPKTSTPPSAKSSNNPEPASPIRPRNTSTTSAPPTANAARCWRECQPKSHPNPRLDRVPVDQPRGALPAPLHSQKPEVVLSAQATSSNPAPGTDVPLDQE
jgi:hypothetical protein